MTNLNTLSKQWARRPDDQRFTTMEALKASVDARKEQSWTTASEPKTWRVLPQESGDLAVHVHAPSRGEEAILTPSNWAFNQLSYYAQAPANYLRTIPAELAAINLQWGLEHNPIRDNGLMLARSNGGQELRAITSESYGRIWDSQVVDAVMKVNPDGRWQIPAASYAASNMKRATTLYASDRDVFIFLCDPNNPVEVEGETLFRGFYVFNSEVGSAVFGLTTFLYRFICDNRIIWDVSGVQELRIRHTSGAPDRFAMEGQNLLTRYANESTKKIVDGIVLAKQTDVPVNKDETVEQWLMRHRFTKTEATRSVEFAVAEEGSSRTIWDIVNGITAYARSIQHTDARVTLEAKAGKLMAIATK